MHAELGTNNPRQTADEMKVCCTHFQCAAWAFQQLMDDKKLFRSNDMSNDVLQFFVQIMLAQAQECILDKSLLDNRKPSIVAKVAAQVMDYYKCAITMLLQGATSSQSSLIDVIGSKLFKEWKKMVEFKQIYYHSIASLYMGNFAESQQKNGERVSWFELADSKIKEAIKLAKQLDLQHAKITEALVFVNDVITAKVGISKKENDFIYHEKVVPVESLQMIKGASLVKGIPFNISDPEVSGPDIFSRLVPMKAHQTASIYTAKKDELLRNIRKKMEGPNEELVAFVSSLQVDKDTLRTPREEPIPNELVSFCAELSLNLDSLETLDTILQQLETISTETNRLINETKDLLEQEKLKEKQHQESFGKRPPSLILMELSKELSKHEETHQKALASNQTLWDNFDKIRDDIMIMMSSSASKIASLLPSCKDIQFDEQVITEMERLFDKIDEMKRQRLMLEEQLLTEMNNENVIKIVLEHANENIEERFDEEIKKYDKIISLIEQNLSAQKNILRAMTDCNARYAKTKKNILEVQQNRKTRIASLLYAFEVFTELQSKSRKGLEFYTKFQEFVTRLNARVQGVSKVQDEERAQFCNVQEKKLNIGAEVNPLATAPTAGSFPRFNSGSAKLKDFLPYLNRKPTVVSGATGNYPFTTGPSAVPLTQNYPPQVSMPLTSVPGTQPMIVANSASMLYGGLVSRPTMANSYSTPSQYSQATSNAMSSPCIPTVSATNNSQVPQPTSQSYSTRPSVLPPQSYYNHAYSGSNYQATQRPFATSTVSVLPTSSYSPVSGTYALTSSYSYLPTSGVNSKPSNFSTNTNTVHSNYLNQTNVYTTSQPTNMFNQHQQQQQYHNPYEQRMFMTNSQHTQVELNNSQIQQPQLPAAVTSRQMHQSQLPVGVMNQNIQTPQHPVGVTNQNIPQSQLSVGVPNQNIPQPQQQQTIVNSQYQPQQLSVSVANQHLRQHATNVPNQQISQPQVNPVVNPQYPTGVANVVQGGQQVTTVPNQYQPQYQMTGQPTINNATQHLSQYQQQIANQPQHSQQPVGQVTNQYRPPTVNQYVPHAPIGGQMSQNQIPSQPSTQVSNQMSQYQQVGVMQLPNTNGTNYYNTPVGCATPQPPNQYQPSGGVTVPNGEYSVVQQLELESKGGWPVLTPTQMDSEKDSQNVEANSASVDALPDILATMSISNQTATLTTGKETIKTKSANDVECLNESKANSTPPSTETKSDNGEPKDLLSQFDPLFT